MVRGCIVSNDNEFQLRVCGGETNEGLLVPGVGDDGERVYCNK